MASKKESITLSTFKKGTLIVNIVGDSELILCAKTRSYELAEIFKQSHPKGTKIPDKFLQEYNLWEKLITSIHWEKPIEFHDDDWSLYTEEEWNKYMSDNRPCILGKAFQDSLKEAFVSCGFKESTGKAGTDFKRTIMFSPLIPISFTQAGYTQHLAQTSGLNRTNVLTQANVFSGWGAELRINYLETAFPKATILDLVACAGDFIGVGSRRGEGYGRYHVESVMEIK